MEGESLSEQKNAGNGMFAALYFKFFRTSIASLDPEKVQLPTFLHTIHHVYRSTRAAREATPHFGEALKCSVHDCETAWLILMLTWIC